MSQHNTIALVTGSSRGLGKNMAMALAKNGNDLVITYNKNKDEALAVVAEINALGRKACALQLEALPKHWQRLLRLTSIATNSTIW